MRKILLVIIQLSLYTFIQAQAFDNRVESVINNINIDSLLSNVRILSGEDSVYVNGEKTLIEHRVAGWNNSLAEDYLVQRMERYGFVVTRQNYSSQGTNVFATLSGSLYPDQYYMICAHYDAVTYYAADDNGSGTATVLEAARVLSQENFPYSIIFAFWDQEEIGLVGSNYYADVVSGFGMDINAVINIDMIGWDGNNDGLLEIHTKPVSESISLANFVNNMNETYYLGLNPIIINPGTTASDHSSFWNYNYSAVLLIEAYYSNDFNPYYHTTSDRINQFNIPYFHKSAQLAIGSITSLALSNFTGIMADLKSNDVYISNYPNPFRGHTTIDFNLSEPSDVTIMLLDQFGRHVKEIFKGNMPEGTHKIQKMLNLEKGCYHLILQTNKEILTHKLFVVG